MKPTFKIPEIRMREVHLCEKPGCFREGHWTMSGTREPMIFYACPKHLNEVLLKGQQKDHL